MSELEGICTKVRVGSHSDYITPRLWDSVGFNRAQRKRISAGKSINVFLKQNVVTGVNMVFRAKFIPDILPIPKSRVHDGWIALLVAAISDLQLISEPLVLYRQHLNNQIGGVQKTLLDELEISKRTKKMHILIL